MKSNAIRCIHLMQHCCIPIALTTPMIPSVHVAGQRRREYETWESVQKKESR